MRNYKSGWIPDVPDIRDWLYAETFKLAAQVALPIRKWWPPSEWFKKPVYKPDVDLLPQMPPVYDQGSIGSCVENAAAGLFSFVEAKEGNGQELMSRLFMYYNVREGKPVDSGSSIRACIKSVATVGACKEELWPYNLDAWSLKPGLDAFVEAAHRKNIQYARLITLDDMINCIDSGYPFIFGMSIYGPFDNLKGKDCTLPMPRGSDEFLGAHGQLAVGVDSRRQAFRVRNSWGPNWGDGGYYWLPWDYIASPMLADDFWTVRKVAA